MRARNLVFVSAFFLCITLVYSSTLSPYAPIKPQTNQKVQEKAATELLQRVLGKVLSKWFRIQVQTTPQFLLKDGFDLLKKKEKESIKVTAPTGASAVWGVYYYLKKYCNFQVSWDGDNVNVRLNSFPNVQETVLAQDEFRYYQNPRASGYSYVWWDWKRWEREIDWMALNGVNMALAFTAQEAIWDRVYKSFGLTADDYPAAPFLPWYRLGQLKKYRSGLPFYWFRDQIKLQHKILRRMRDLGITPVLPGFCGIVSDALQKVMPMLNGTKTPKWEDFSDDFCCRTFVSPFNPAYAIIAVKYFTEYISEFGTNHIYSCDAYLQLEPDAGEEKYLMALSVAHIAPMLVVDPLSVWMIDASMFKQSFWDDKNRVKSFLTAIPLKKLIILDLEADWDPQYKRFNSYYGHSFIWCALHSYGGQSGLYGNLQDIDKGILEGRYYVLSSMIGIGITPEGINQNYIIYEFTLDSTLRLLPADTKDWVTKYALRRYGVLDEDLKDAWLILKDTAYSYDSSNLKRESAYKKEKASLEDGEYISDNILTKRPQLNLTELTWYDKSKMFDVYEKFVNATLNKSPISSTPLFRHDLIDVTRQTIQLTISSLYFKIIKAFDEKDNENFQERAQIFLDLLDQLINILSCGVNFLFGNWIMPTALWSKTYVELRKLSEDGRNLITTWGPNGELRDYASRQWSEVVSEYYKPRWVVFINALNESITNDTKYNQDEVDKEIYETVELPYLKIYNKYIVNPVKMPEKEIADFNDEWGPIMYDILNDKND